MDFLVGEHTLKDHTVSIHQYNTKSKLISFFNIPPYIPDEELIHLVQCFGKLRYDKINHDVHEDNLVKGILNRNRRLNLELNDGISLPTFFWLDGIQSIDIPARITVKILIKLLSAIISPIGT